MDVGRKTRSIPPAIRRALNSRDRGCRFPGCCFKRYVDGHHVKHWANGGETTLSNLVTLCRFHHRLVHEGSAEVRILDDGTFRFVKSNGDAFDRLAPPEGDWTALIAMHESIRISPKTAITRWAGERLDLGLAVDVLMQRRKKSVPAGTS